MSFLRVKGFVRPSILVLALAALGAERHVPLPQFIDKAAEAGLHIHIVSGDPDEKKFLVESVGGGLAVIDFDNDGWMDVYIPNGSTIALAREGKPGASGALYRNRKDGTFADVTKPSGIVNPYWGKGALAADLNNDGLQDLYITNFGPNLLYLNNGDGTFRDATAKAGVGDPRWSSAAAAADYDGDGDLDLFVVNYVHYDLNHLPTEGKFCQYMNLKVACGPRGLDGAGNALYRNNGDGTFTDVTAASGIAGAEAFYGLGATWGDYDLDGDQDLVVANDTTPNDLYRNNGNGTFTNVAMEAGVAFSEDGREQAGMGVELEDLDNDGAPDLLVSNFSDDYNTLYRNLGKGYFADDSHRAGLVADTWRDLSWGTGFVDFNNDGWKDVFIANGHIYPQVESSTLQLRYRQTNKLYLNTGTPRLENISAKAGPGLAEPRSYRGAAFADFNNDGQMDIALTALDATPSLLINQGTPANHWLLVQLAGKRNRFGIGARVIVTANGITQSREVKAGASYASSNDLRAHFGLGKAAIAQAVEVHWPGGSVTRMENVKANQILKIQE